MSAASASRTGRGGGGRGRWASRGAEFRPVIAAGFLTIRPFGPSAPLLTDQGPAGSGVCDKPGFTQTFLTGRTMRFPHDSSPGSSSTPPQEETARRAGLGRPPLGPLPVLNVPAEKPFLPAQVMDVQPVWEVNGLWRVQPGRGGAHVACSQAHEAGLQTRRRSSSLRPAR